MQFLHFLRKVTELLAIHQKPDFIGLWTEKPTKFTKQNSLNLHFQISKKPEISRSGSEIFESVFFPLEEARSHFFIRPFPIVASCNRGKNTFHIWGRRKLRAYGLRFFRKPRETFSTSQNQNWCSRFLGQILISVFKHGAFNRVMIKSENLISPQTKKINFSSLPSVHPLDRNVLIVQFLCFLLSVVLCVPPDDCFRKASILLWCLK